MFQRLTRPWSHFLALPSPTQDLFIASEHGSCRMGSSPAVEDSPT